MLIIFSIPMLIITLAIKLGSKGPVFYRQIRVGMDQKEFEILKFRTMKEDAEQDSGPKWSTQDDPRRTKIGRILRSTSLDELPQFINVLKGQMSLVGPRPCLPYEYEIYKEWYKKRTSVRPGITGLWQVAGRSEVSFEDMILLDLYYIYNRSLMMDFSIMYETIFVVLAKKGAY